MRSTTEICLKIWDESRLVQKSKFTLVTLAVFPTHSENFPQSSQKHKKLWELWILISAALFLRARQKYIPECKFLFCQMQVKQIENLATNTVQKVLANFNFCHFLKLSRERSNPHHPSNLENIPEEFDQLHMRKCILASDELTSFSRIDESDVPTMICPQVRRASTSWVGCSWTGGRCPSTSGAESSRWPRWAYAHATSPDNCSSRTAACPRSWPATTRPAPSNPGPSAAASLKFGYVHFQWNLTSFKQKTSGSLIAWTFSHLKNGAILWFFPEFCREQKRNFYVAQFNFAKTKEKDFVKSALSEHLDPILDFAATFLSTKMTNNRQNNVFKHKTVKITLFWRTIRPIFPLHGTIFCLHTF